MPSSLDAVVDRAADILERVSAEVDQVSREIFERSFCATSMVSSFSSMTLFTAVAIWLATWARNWVSAWLKAQYPVRS